MAWKPDYVDLAATKKFVRINSGVTVDDAELGVYITATSRAIDDECNRQFGKLATPQTLYFTPWYNSERDRWIIDIEDLMDLTGFTLTIAGVATTAYTLEPINAALDAMPWTSLSINPRTAAVVPTGDEYEAAGSALWGWTAFPAKVPMAARLQVSRLAARRDSPYGIAGSPDTGSELRLLDKLDPDVSLMLNGLRRPRKVG